MLSKQELLSYVRAAYQEYLENQEQFNDTLDNLIEGRWMNASKNDKRRFNAVLSDNSRTIYQK